MAAHGSISGDIGQGDYWIDDPYILILTTRSTQIGEELVKIRFSDLQSISGLIFLYLLLSP
jgi:hypothetical protein